VRDRGPSGFGPDQPGPDRLQYSSVVPTKSNKLRGRVLCTLAQQSY
jgi:hypothetical protein